MEARERNGEEEEEEEDPTADAAPDPAGAAALWRRGRSDDNAGREIERAPALIATYVYMFFKRAT